MRVRLDLRLRRGLTAPGEELQLRLRPAHAHREVGGAGASGSRRGEAALDDPILERVVRDHDDPTSRSQHPHGDVERIGECIQLVVDGDPNGLEGASSGMAPGPPGPSRHGGGHDLGEMDRVRDRAGGDDRPRDAGGVTLLAEAPEDAGDVAEIPLVDDRGGVERCVRAHAHVEGAPAPIGEPSLPHVELVRGDAEVEEGAVDLIAALLGEDATQLAEVGLTEADPRPEPVGLETRVRVPIEREDLDAIVRLEQDPGVAAAPEGGVHDVPTDRAEPVLDPVGHDRHVIVPAHHQPSGALAPRWKRAE